MGGLHQALFFTALGWFLQGTEYWPVRKLSALFGTDLDDPADEGDATPPRRASAAGAGASERKPRAEGVGQIEAAITRVVTSSVQLTVFHFGLTWCARNAVALRREHSSPMAPAARPSCTMAMIAVAPPGCAQGVALGGGRGDCVHPRYSLGRGGVVAGAAQLCGHRAHRADLLVGARVGTQSPSCIVRTIIG